LCRKELNFEATTGTVESGQRSSPMREGVIYKSAKLKDSAPNRIGPGTVFPDFSVGFREERAK
jgi:hypothetical protein